MSVPSAAEVNQWVSRLDDVTAAIHELLNEDPMVEVEKKQLRESRRREEAKAEEAAKLARVKMRYEPKFYSRYERDEVIDAMLRAVDEGDTAGRARSGTRVVHDESLYSKAEIVSLEEGKRLKQEAAQAVQKADWSTALLLYSNAIKLDVPDEALKAALYNNRALVHLKLAMYMETVEDATCVLQKLHEANNVKALLRRAQGLRHLHRPVEALADIALALKLEPTNQEALAQRSWLKRAEVELMRSDAFVSEEKANEEQRVALGSCGKGENMAKLLCEAIDVLACAGTSTSVSTRRCSCEEKVLALDTCTRIIQTRGDGAAVFFALRGGVGRTLALAQQALDTYVNGSTDCSSGEEKTGNSSVAGKDVYETEVALLLVSMRLLALVMQDCEVATQEVAETAVRTFCERLCQFLSNDTIPRCDEQKGRAVHIKLVSTSLQCLTSLCRFFKTVVCEALEVEGACTLTKVWRSIARSASAETSSVLQQYSYTGLLDALVKGFSVGDFDSPLGQQLLESTSTVDGDDPLVLRAVWLSLHHEAPLQLQRVGAALGLRLSSISSAGGNGKNGTEGRLALVVTMLAAPSSTKRIYDILMSALSKASAKVTSRKPRAASQSSTASTSLWLSSSSDEEYPLLEALFSLIYNLILQASPREAYLQQWLALPHSITHATCVCLTLSTSDEHQQQPMCALSSKMLSVMAKFLPSDTELQKVLAQYEGHLWQWWHHVLFADHLSADNSSLSTCIAWEHVEHLSAILATAYMKQYIALPTSPDHKHKLGSHLLDAANLSHILLRVLELASPPTESAVALLEDSRSVSEDDLRAATARLVSLGNTALLFSYGVSPAFTSTAIIKALEAAKAMDILLAALRMTRTSALLLASEKAAREALTVIPATTIAQLALWHAHALSAQKNLAIAISKTCAVSESLKTRLRDMNGFETLMAVSKS